MSYKYNVLKFPLTDGLNERVSVQGGFIYIKDATDANVVVDVQPDSRSNDKITLKKGFGVVAPFRELFITATAQAGKTVDILITDSFDTFRVFEQVSNQDIGTVGSITNPVTINSPIVSGITNPVTIVNPTVADVLKWGGTTQTGWDFNVLQKNLDGQYGTSVQKSALGLSNGTTIIHTVTAGKTLLLESINFLVGNGNSTNYANILVRNTSDVTTNYLMGGYYLGIGSYENTLESISFPTPMPIPAGYDICAYSASAAIYISAYIKGREI